MATAKKILNEDYKVQLTLSAQEARLVQLFIGRSLYTPNDTGLNIFEALRSVNGWMPIDDGPQNCTDYRNYPKTLTNWVENGE